MNTKTDSQPFDSTEANKAAGGDCVSRLVRQSLQDWIDSGRGDECFWEGWPECPTEIELTPNMILAVLNSLPNSQDQG